LSKALKLLRGFLDEKVTKKSRQNEASTTKGHTPPVSNTGQALFCPPPAWKILLHLELISPYRDSKITKINVTGLGVFIHQRLRTGL
jgi:hypothetical protein